MRPSKVEYYLNIAAQVAKRGTCLRRNFGAVIVRDDQIISTGYTGAPRGTKNCVDIGVCPREKAGAKPGEKYELCRSVHAEQNAIINAARSGVSVLGGTLYLYGEMFGGKNIDASPCGYCKREIINAGLKNVIMRQADGSFKEYSVDSYVQEYPTDYTQGGDKLAYGSPNIK